MTYEENNELIERIRQLEAELAEAKGQKEAAPKKKRPQEKGKATRVLTVEQYHEIIDTMRAGGCGFRANNRNATALVVQANLGLRIGDVLRLKPSDFVRDGDRWRLNISESKTGKARTFTVPSQLHMYIDNYCLRNGIGPKDRIFPVSVRTLQEHLQRVCEYLDYENIGTHSFRKFFATQIYTKNGYDIALVQKLLQHSSPATTQRYIGIQPEKLEAAIENNVTLI